MIRRFHINNVLVTGLRIDGKWVINKVAYTVATVRGGYDQPGEYLGTIKKVGGEWAYELPDNRGTVYGCPTLEGGVGALIQHAQRKAAA